MRSLLVLAALTTLAPAALGAAALRLSAQHATVNVTNPVHLAIRNEGDAAAQNVVLTLGIESGVVFHQVTNSPPWSPLLGWSCTSTPSDATCTLASLPAGGEALAILDFRQTIPRGGHRKLTATLGAHDTPTQTVTVDVVARHHLTVTTASDFGAGSLRAVLEEINEDPLCGTDVPCQVDFAGAMEISPATPLPVIRKCNVSIRGPEQDIADRYAVKLVVINGENAAYGNGLHIRVSSCADPNGVSIRSLAIHSWPWNGVLFEGGPYEGAMAHLVLFSYIGTDATGLAGRGNGSRGIVVDSPNDYFGIGGVISSANGRSGIAAFRGKKLEVGGAMKLGVSRSGEPLGNGASGFFSAGVPFYILDGEIAYNAHAGVAIAPGTVLAHLDQIASHSNGGLPVDWGLDDRTPPDDEEIDKVPNTPRILQAFYDAANSRTVVRGVVRVRPDSFGDIALIRVYAAGSERGDVPNQLISAVASAAVSQKIIHDLPFEVFYRGDLRGRLVTAQLDMSFGASFGRVSSEMSEAVEVK